MTKNLIKISLISLVALTCATGAAFANSHGHKFEEQDTNKDGKVSKEESTANAQKRFDEIDTNKDGAITKEELTAHYDKKRKDHCKE